MKRLLVLLIAATIAIGCLKETAGTLDDVGSGSISGQLQTEEHQPVDYPVSVELYRNKSNSGSGSLTGLGKAASVYDSLIRTIITDSGSYLFNALAAGDYHVEVRNDDIIVSTTETFSLDDDESLVDTVVLRDILVLPLILSSSSAEEIGIGNSLINNCKVVTTDSGCFVKAVKADEFTFDLVIQRNFIIDTVKVKATISGHNTVSYEVTDTTVPLQFDTDIITFDKRINTPDTSEMTFTVLETDDDGFIIAAFSQSINGTLKTGIGLYRTDRYGDVTSIRIFNIPLTMYKSRNLLMQQTDDGGYIVTYNLYDGDIHLLKVDGDLDSVWSTSVPGSESEYAAAIQQTSDGEFVIASAIHSTEDVWADFGLVKTDGNGNELWSKRFVEGSTEAIPGAMQQTSDGGYIIAGSTRDSYNQTDTTGFDFHLIKTDNDGEMQWSKTISGPTDANSNDVCTDIQLTNDNGYILAGYTGSYNYDTMPVGWDKNIYLVKTGGNGDVEWKKQLGSTNVEAPVLVRQTTDNGYIICAPSPGFGSQIIKTDGTGAVIWSRKVGNMVRSPCNDLRQTGDGGYILVGYTYSDSNIYLIKTDENGNVNNVY